MICYPAIDLIGGKCVRLAQGDFNRVTRYEQDPLEVAWGYRRSGAFVAHVVDLDGARSGAPRQAALIGEIARATGLVVQSGGGIRSVADARALLDAGVSRVVIGSLAVKKPLLAREIFSAIGSNRFTLAVDVRLGDAGEPRVATSGWQESGGVSLWDVLDSFVGLGLRRLLCTDIGRDGMLGGPNLSLYRDIFARYPELELQASGGVGSLSDLQGLRTAGIPAVIIGRALFEGRFTLSEALQC